MRYCGRCILPDTRPNLTLDAEGICNACRAHETKPEIDWDKREKAFRDVVEHSKSRSKSYDCLIPVSGGKDSTWQTVKCLEYGMTPLAVTWKTPARTEVGARNLANLVSLGVDHIDYQVNPKTEKKFMYQSLVRFGTTAVPMHMALFNIPLRIAVRFEIPLIVWGENSAFEYGGDKDESRGFKLDEKWYGKFGVTHGTKAEDWVSGELTAKEMTPYVGPSPEELEKSGTLAVFLGYYFPWDPEISFRTAKEHGFQVSEDGPRTGYYNFADIDDDFISIHHFIKWYKFGMTRLFDNLSLEIRNGRMRRSEAVQILRETGEQTPHEDIAKCCEFMGTTREHFFEVIEKFRNKNIWANKNGTWMIENFLVPDWKWK
jgi:N-acetyl sugar amidotransferase